VRATGVTEFICVYGRALHEEVLHPLSLDCADGCELLGSLEAAHPTRLAGARSSVRQREVQRGAGCFLSRGVAAIPCGEQ
jgi:hypothetical protein